VPGDLAPRRRLVVLLRSGDPGSGWETVRCVGVADRSEANDPRPYVAADHGDVVILKKNIDIVAPAPKSWRVARVRYGGGPYRSTMPGWFPSHARAQPASGFIRFRATRDRLRPPGCHAEKGGGLGRSDFESRSAAPDSSSTQLLVHPQNHMDAAKTRLLGPRGGGPRHPKLSNGGKKVSSTELSREPSAPFFSATPT
jgi:hypothetical protein